MRIFLKKTILFLFGIPLILSCAYCLIDTILNRTYSSKGTIFIWGDSQTYRGIDLDVLQTMTNRKINSAARHGAGVYDFLVFAEKVPSNSEVIITLSKTVQLRRKQADRNNTGISVGALISLLEHNYALSEVYSILKRNRTPMNLFLNNTQLYPYSDSIVWNEPISTFENIYSKTPVYLEDKQKLMLLGIRKLKEKNCRISFLEFPYHPILREIESRSEVKIVTENFKNQVEVEFEQFSVDTIYIERTLQAMYDLTHLNQKGAERVSENIAENIAIRKHPTLYIVHW